VIPLPLGRVLVVDDNEDLAQLFSTLIVLLGYECQAVYSATDALSVIPSYSPHVIFSDIGMPGSSGHDLAQAIRSGAWPQPFLIAVSGWNDVKTVRKSLEAGFDVHLVKPVSYDQVSKLLLNHFESLNMQDQLSED
jgi:CheY-like chemotaxis protein